MDGAAWQALADKWDIIMMAPQAFLAAIGIGAIGGWLLVRIIYNNRLTHYQELIANYRDFLEDKIPARALRPFPIKRSKQMSLGLVFIFVGISAVIIGAVVVATDRSPSSENSGKSDLLATRRRLLPVRRRFQCPHIFFLRRFIQLSWPDTRDRSQSC
jgi:hypothetical protein